MRFEVPQFIEIEDKIFTWKQFIYIAGGFGLCIILFLSTSFFIAVIISLPIVALTGALAFHRVNNRPFSIFLESMVGYFSHSRLYVWRQDKAQAIIDRTEKPIVETESQKILHPPVGAPVPYHTNWNLMYQNKL